MLLPKILARFLGGYLTIFKRAIKPKGTE